VHLGASASRTCCPRSCRSSGTGDLEIQDGQTASAALEALLLGGDALTEDERTALRRKLLRYCERGTLAMVRLHERLREVGRGR
jgi:hypothetical protein